MFKNKSKGEESGLAPIWNWKITAFAAALLLFVGILAISFGPVSLSFQEIIRTLLGLPGGLTGQDRTLLIDLRLPRALLAALVGAALATSGAVYQTVFRNPLAYPYLLGAAAGAGACVCYAPRSAPKFGSARVGAETPPSRASTTERSTRGRPFASDSTGQPRRRSQLSCAVGRFKPVRSASSSTVRNTRHLLLWANPKSSRDHQPLIPLEVGQVLALPSTFLGVALAQPRGRKFHVFTMNALCSSRRYVAAVDRPMPSRRATAARLRP